MVNYQCVDQELISERFIYTHEANLDKMYDIAMQSRMKLFIEYEYKNGKMIYGKTFCVFSYISVLDLISAGLALVLLECIFHKGHVQRPQKVDAFMDFVINVEIIWQGVSSGSSLLSSPPTLVKRDILEQIDQQKGSDMTSTTDLNTLDFFHSVYKTLLDEFYYFYSLLLAFSFNLVFVRIISLIN